VILYGAGGHGKVVYSLLKDQGEPVIAVIDDNPMVKEFMGHKVSHEINSLSENESMIIAVGDNRTRRKIANQFSFGRFGVVIHSYAVRDGSSKIGEGTIVMPLAVINSDSNLGKHCIINTAAIIEHDCQIDDFVHVAPNATICGDCTIGEGTLIGAGATVIPGIKIGEWCTIGAGTVVIRDVPDGKKVVGNPSWT